MEELIKESTNLYNEIDDCITKMLKAKLDKDANKEREVFCEMSTLLVNTMQHISWLVGTLKGCSLIKWQTGEPPTNGVFLVVYKGYVCVFERKREFWMFHGKIISDKDTTAWCRLSTIQPYKGKEGRNEH